MASPLSAAAEAAWAKDLDWIVPILCRSEFRNALAGSIRQRSIAVEEASAIANLAEAILDRKGVHGFDLSGSSTRFEIEMLAL